MNSPEFNNYIQYVTRSGIVKSKSVIFQDNGTNTTFEVSGINEDFFIIAVFQNNLQRFGIGFENFDNVNMLGFINSNMIDISCIPTNSYLNSEQVVIMSYNNDYVDDFFNRTQTDPLQPQEPLLQAITKEQHYNNITNFQAYDENSQEVVDMDGYYCLNVRPIGDLSSLYNGDVTAVKRFMLSLGKNLNQYNIYAVDMVISNTFIPLPFEGFFGYCTLYLGAGTQFPPHLDGVSQKLGYSNGNNNHLFLTKLNAGGNDKIKITGVAIVNIGG